MLSRYGLRAQSCIFAISCEIGLHSRPPPVRTIRKAQTEPFFGSSDFDEFDTHTSLRLTFEPRALSFRWKQLLILRLRRVKSSCTVHAVRPPTCASNRMCTHLESRVTHSRATPSPLFCADALVPSSACADLNIDPRTSSFGRDETKRAQGQVLLGWNRLGQVSHERPEPVQTASPPLSALRLDSFSENPRLSRATGL